MSISDLTLFNTLAFSLDNTTANLQTLEQQLSTGKRVNQPSDGPAAFAQGELYTQQQSAITNDVSIATLAQNQLSSTDGALASVNTALDTALQDATQGSDGTLNASQMASIGQAVGGLLSQVIGSANFQYGASYVFGGNQVLTPPFNSSGNYSGDAGTNSAQLSDGTKLPLTFNGQAIFGDSTTGVIGALTALQTALNAGNQTAVAATLPQLQAAITQIAQVRSGIGGTINAAANEVTVGNTNIISLTSSITTATGLDIAKGAAQLQLLNLQEQALVSLGTDLGKIPLINVLA
jgi:flagellar hook-associated protein 3 FlgL